MTKWDERNKDRNVPDELVNIADPVQRDLEWEYIRPWLREEDTVLEVGCGNGYTTNLISRYVHSVIGVDVSEEAIVRATENRKNSNITFAQGSVLYPFDVECDVVLCIRVLCNLKSIEEQQTALDNLYRCVRPKGVLIICEGFMDGFDELNKVRNELQGEIIVPNPHNFYSYVKDLTLPGHVIGVFNTGLYDYLTRIVHPFYGLSSEYNEKAMALHFTTPSTAFDKFARVRGFVIGRGIE